MNIARIALVPLVLLSFAVELRGNESQNGLIDVYASQFQGRPTASGEIYNPNDLTAAHATLPFGTRVRVANFESGKMVDVRINDRKGADGRLMHLSHAAGYQLGIPANRAVRGSFLVLAAAPVTAVRRTPIPAPVTAAPAVPATAQGYPLPPVVEEKRGLFQKKKTQYGIPSSQYEPYLQPNQAPATKEGVFSGLFGGKQKRAANAHVYPQSNVPAMTGTNPVIPMSAGSATVQGVNGPIPRPGAVPQRQVQPVAAQPQPIAYPPAAPVAASAPYRVQFGAFRRASNAQELSGMLSNAGIGTSVVQANPDALNFVVTRGGFRTAEEAQKWIDFEGARRGWKERPVVIR